MSMMSSRRSLGGVVAVAALALIGCAGDAGSGDGVVSVMDPWARTTPGAAVNGVVYLELRSSSGDALVGVSVDPSIAARAEVHETITAPAATGTDGADTGLMTMKPVERLELPAGEKVLLESGGLHIMLIELADPLEAGETFELTLTFDELGDVVVPVEVGDEAP